MKEGAILFFIFLLYTGCDIRKREENLQQLKEQLNQKEQELLAKEKSLQLREEELLKWKRNIDSINLIIPKDTSIYKAELIGLWTVRMNCTETNCPGAAVGDTKTEQWNISYQNQKLLAKAIVDEKLVRVYLGIYTGSSLELAAQQSDTATQNAAQIIVRLEEESNGILKGTREITRAGNCKTIYAVNMVKS